MKCATYWNQDDETTETVFHRVAFARWQIVVAAYNKSEIFKSANSNREKNSKDKKRDDWSVITRLFTDPSAQFQSILKEP